MEPNSVNPDNITKAVNYLKENKDSFSESILKENLLSQGYTVVEIETAVRRLDFSGEEAQVIDYFELGNLYEAARKLFFKNIGVLLLIFSGYIAVELIYNFVNYEALQRISKASESDMDAVFNAFKETEKLTQTPFNLALSILSFIFYVVGIATLYKAVIDLDAGSKVGFISSYKRIFPVIFSYLFVIILYTLIIFGGLILLIVPGILFAVWYIFSELALLAENKKGISALKRSYYLAKGSWWAIFGRLMLLLLVYLGFLVISVIFQPIPYLNVVVETFLNTGMTIFFVVFNYYMYKGLCFKKEVY